jgi:hypothetical protein
MKFFILLIVVLVPSLSFSADSDAWRKWTKDTKVGWVLGFRYGNIIYCGLSTEEISKKLNKNPQAYYSECLKRNVENGNPVVIAASMDEMYKDHANYYVGLMDMYYVAVGKIYGEDYKFLLIEARKKGIDNKK